MNKSTQARKKRSKEKSKMEEERRVEEEKGAREERTKREVEEGEGGSQEGHREEGPVRPHTGATGQRLS